MENASNGPNRQLFGLDGLSKEESEELVLIYLEDYYQSLDDFYLKEAMQIAKDEGIDVQKIMRLAKSRMN